LVWEGRSVAVSGKESDDPWGFVWGMVWVWDCYSSCIPCSREKHHRVVVVTSQGKRRMMISAAGQSNRSAISVEVVRSAVLVVRTAVLVPVLWRIHTMMIDYDLVVVVDLDVVADVVHVVVDAVGVVVCALFVAVEQ